MSLPLENPQKEKNTSVQQPILIPVVLCGGSGTRLWPLSRSFYPKQFCPLVGKESLFQHTVKRTINPLFSGSLIVVANQNHQFLVEKELKALNISNYKLILEPCPRNTTPAITLAAMAALQENLEAILLVMPSDHLIQQEKEFLAVVEKGLPAAQEGFFMTFGVHPTRPETGYGYIQYKYNPELDVQDVLCFVEKPSAELAKQYIETKDFLWNSGSFMFKASDFLQAVMEYEPLVYKHCQEAFNAKNDIYPCIVEEKAFKKSPSISVDYGIMERTPKAKVLPLPLVWNDLGSWQALWEVDERDSQGNALIGDVIIKDVNNSYVRSENRLVTVLGLDNVVVVESPDAVLVASRSAAQDVKKIVENLQSENRPHTKTHLSEERPWGSYESIDKGERFHVKRITVKPGAKLSLQMHHHRAEHWVIVSGTAKVTRGEEEITLFENQSIYIPCGIKHRLENPGKIPLELIEVQSGAYLGEDDIIRFNDVYGRK